MRMTIGKDDKRVRGGAIAAAAVLMAIPGLTLATTGSTPNVSGAYTGTGTEKATCTNPPFVETGSGFGSLDLQQTNSSFSGTGTAGDDSLTITNGTVSTTGAVMGNWATDDASGTFQGQYTDGVVKGTYTGFENPDASCMSGYNLSGTFDLVQAGSNVIGGGSAGVKAVSNPTSVAGNIRGTTVPQQVRLKTGRSKKAAGVKKVGANGFMLQGGGLSAGDGFSFPTGVWLSFSHSDFENDLSSTAYDGDRYNVVGGVDFNVWESLIVGVAVGYESSDVDTTFNSGEVESDGITVSPYMGMVLTDVLSVDFSFGYSDLDFDQFRTDVVSRINSDLDGDRWFAAGNVHATHAMGQFLLNGQAGFLVARETQDNFNETRSTGQFVAAIPERDVKLGQFRIGGDVTYAVGNFEPFAGAIYEYDYSFEEVRTPAGTAQPANDRDDFLVMAGIRYFGTENFSGSLEWNGVVGREDYEDDTFNMTVRWDF